jgi:hypothetical protein
MTIIWVDNHLLLTRYESQVYERFMALWEGENYLETVKQMNLGS